jgi:beta-lactamase class D
MLIVFMMLGGTGNLANGQGVDAVAEVFQVENVIGTLVVATADGSPVYVLNEDRSRVQFSPASTFKIPNTLIALDAGVVTSKKSSFTWDGTDKGRSAWNKDQSLESAFRVSCVWCYQEIARDVGGDRYVTDLESLKYGNQDIGSQVDMFWLNGDLKISAMEQIAFLSELYNSSVPFKREHVDLVKSIMLVEETADYSHYAKSGWTGPTQHIGWYVGYVEKGDDVWLFAMNMRMDRAEQAGLRKELTVRSLRALGLL